METMCGNVISGTKKLVGKVWWLFQTLSLADVERLVLVYKPLTLNGQINGHICPSWLKACWSTLEIVVSL